MFQFVESKASTFPLMTLRLVPPEVNAVVKITWESGGRLKDTVNELELPSGTMIRLVESTIVGAGLLTIIKFVNVCTLVPKGPPTFKLTVFVPAAV